MKRFKVSAMEIHYCVYQVEAENKEDIDVFNKATWKLNVSYVGETTIKGIEAMEVGDE